MEDRELAAALGALYREMGALYGVVARGVGLTAQQVQLLCTLSHDKPSFGEVAGLLGCDKTNVTGMVDRLERRGFLARETDRSDRRVTRVVLTEDGEALREGIRAELAKAFAERCGSLSRDDRGQLVWLTRAAADALGETRPPGR